MFLNLHRQNDISHIRNNKWKKWHLLRGLYLPCFVIFIKWLSCPYRYRTQLFYVWVLDVSFKLWVPSWKYCKFWVWKANLLRKLFMVSSEVSSVRMELHRFISLKSWNSIVGVVGLWFWAFLRIWDPKF